MASVVLSCRKAFSLNGQATLDLPLLMVDSTGSIGLDSHMARGIGPLHQRTRCRVSWRLLYIRNARSIGYTSSNKVCPGF